MTSVSNRQDSAAANGNSTRTAPGPPMTPPETPGAAPKSAPGGKLSRRAEITAYTTAFFSVSLMPMTLVIVPLWALELGASATLIGIAAGARSLLPFLFSIHGGALLDRLGVRRVMVFCAAASCGLALLYPVVPLIGALIAFQVIAGFLQTMGWIGAQTQIGQLTGGQATYMGRFTFVSTIANFFTPPLAGLAWDLAGAWGAFGAISAWAGLLWISAAAMPVPAGATIQSGPLRWRDLLPTLTDYRKAIRLAAAPAVGFVVLCSFLMNATISMRFAFLPVYLSAAGYEGAAIGLFIGAAFLIGAPVALAAGPATRALRPQRLLLGLIVLAAIGIGATPAFTGIAGLMFLTALFGIAAGLGRSIGLRTTANRFSSLMIPILMGLLVDILGLAAGFMLTAGLVIGGVLLAGNLARRAAAPQV